MPTADARHCVRREIAADFLGVGRRHRLGDHGIEIDVVGGRVVAADLLVQLGHAELPDPVGDRMVDDRPDRGSAALDAADDDEPPERTRSVERLGIQLRGQVEQLAHRAGCRQHDFADVGIEVELGIGNPCRCRQPCEPGHHTLVEPWRASDSGTQRLAEAVHVERTVEEDDRCATRIEPRILLDVPHERLVFAHPCRGFVGAWSGHGVSVSGRRDVGWWGGSVDRDAWCCESGAHQVSVPGRRVASARGSPE